MHTSIITGRNEVLAKVIFSQASVILLTGGGLVPGGLQFFRGGGLQFSGGSPIFRGVSNFPVGGLRNTVNIRPVRILLECILVPYDSTVVFKPWNFSL